MLNENVNSLTTVQTSGSSKPALPQPMVDFLSVIEKVHAKWQASGLTSAYATPEDLSHLTETIKAKIEEKDGLKAQRRIVAKQIANVNGEINQSVIFIKDALKRDFGKSNFSSYMEKFGFIRHYNRWVLPIGLSARLYSLEKLISALAEYNPDVGKYDAAFWQEKHDELQLLGNKSRELAGLISLAVAKRRTAEQKARKIVQSLIFLVKANYFDNYKAVLRSWGILKETF